MNCQLFGPASEQVTYCHLDKIFITVAGWNRSMYYPLVTVDYTTLNN